MVKPLISKKWDIIVERLFIYKEDLDHIIHLFKESKYKIIIISLENTLKNLIKNDKKREGYKMLGKKDIERLYKVYNDFQIKDKGKVMSVEDKTPKEVCKEIIKYIS